MLKGKKKIFVFFVPLITIAVIVAIFVLRDIKISEERKIENIRKSYISKRKIAKHSKKPEKQITFEEAMKSLPKAEKVKFRP